jgi:redox-sensitive bicupin YhaK (pirin superfamily)
MSIRPVLKTVRGMPASEGAGVRLMRILGTPEARMFDPFLMLDHFDSAEASDYLAGFPDHPHRGFETVTYMLEGRMRHGDNRGHSGVIGTGGVQWMRAGRGIVHSEMPEQTQGRMRGFQLWVNLPASLKMSEPDYQEFDTDRIPVETREGGVEAKIIAGRTSRGTEGPVRGEAAQPVYFDVALPAGAVFEEPLPADRAAMVVVYEGAVSAGEGPQSQIEALGAAFLGDGDTVRIAAKSAARLLIIAGRPIGEPVAWGGPFVMNTREEVEQAFADYRAGRF